MDDWKEGQSLYGDRYVIEKTLGKGGLGITYLARTRNGKQVVIKTLKNEVLTSREYTDFRDKYERDFEREATRLAVCRHSHIVQIENVFHEGSLPCIAMEYVEGEDLWKYVKSRGVLSETEALRYIKQIGEALTIVHEKGLLHRDVKPHNIMIRSNGSEAVLIDFGIAREFIPDVTLHHSAHLRTDSFAPIEQYYEEAHRGEYTDVYALAATLYFLLTKKVPPPAFMRNVNYSLKPPQQYNQNICDRVNQAILKGMALKPEERPQSVQEWIQLLPEQNHSLPPQGDFWQRTYHWRRGASRCAPTENDEPDQHLVQIFREITQNYYNCIKFPFECILQQQVDLRIQLVVQTPAQTRVLQKVSITTDIEVKEVTLYVHITASGFTMQQRHKPLILPVNGDSEEIIFKLVPVDLGEQVVEIEFFHQGSRVEYVLVKTNVKNLVV